MSVLVAALLAAGTAVTGGLLARARLARARRADDPDPAQAAAAAADRAAADAADAAIVAAAEAEAGLVEAAHAPDGLEGFRVRVGDVVLRQRGDEAWLGGALVLEEARPLVALLVSPARGRDVAVLAHAPPNRELAWLAATDLAAGLPPGDLPAVLEHGGLPYERQRRLPLAARAAGEGAPDLAGDVVYGEYRGPARERLVLVRGPGRAPLAFAGEVMLEGSFEIVPSGAAR